MILRFGGVIPKQLTGLRIAVLLERGVNELEYHYSRLRALEAGAEVVVVGNRELDYTGENHGLLRAHATIDKVDAMAFSGVIIPGGLSAEKLRQNQEVVEFVRKLYERGKVCAAICHGQQVLISAGLLMGRKAVAAWSMVDDLTYAGSEHVPDARAVRDGTLVTARFPKDLPEFFALIFECFAETESRPIAKTYGRRLQGKIIGIIVDDATSDMQVVYPQLRIQEEGGKALLVGRRAGAAVRLGNPTWEWADMYAHVVSADLALEDMGAVDSHDLPYEEKLKAVRSDKLDALIVPGGLGTWMIRGHMGLKKLVQDMHKAGKPVAAIERGPKILLSAGILSGKTVTCCAEMRDDLVAAGIDYRDEPVIRDGNLLFCRGTEEMPSWFPAFLEMF